jgi:transposase
MTKLEKMLVDYRLKWVNLVLKKGFSRRTTARLSDHSFNTISLWVKKYLEAGPEGLIDKSRAPLCHPNQYSQDIVDKILEIRNKTRFCALKIKSRLENEYGIKYLFSRNRLCFKEGR